MFLDDETTEETPAASEATEETTEVETPATEEAPTEEAAM